MKKFEITKEQILQLNNYDKHYCKVALKEWFPQAFKIELEIGKWYKHNKFLLYIIDKTHWYGFDVSGAWNDYATYEDLMTDKDLLPATDKEVETALIAEAKRRGFKEGVKYFNASLPSFKETARNNEFKYINSDEVILYLDGNTIFYNGKWAEIISEPIEVTLEEIAEKFNVNVEQLKIKK